jgi:hypothetical protein
MRQAASGAEIIAALEAGKYAKRFDPCEPRRWVALSMFPLEGEREIRLTASFDTQRIAADCLKDAVEHPLEWFIADRVDEPKESAQ